MRSLFVTEWRHDEDVPVMFDRILPLNVVANTVIFYVAARIYLWPQLSRLRAATDSHSRSAFTFNPTLGDDVFSPWRNLSRIAARVRLSRGVRRFGDSDSCLWRDC